MRFLVGMNNWKIRTEHIAAQFGDLSNHAEHGLDMTGYSAYLKNIYLTGALSDRTGDSWFDSATGEMQLFNRTTGNGVSFRYGNCVSDASTRRSPAAALTSIRCCKTSRRRRRYCGRSTPTPTSHPSRNPGQDIRNEYEQLLTGALMRISTEGYRFVDGKVLTTNGQRRVIRL